MSEDVNHGKKAHNDNGRRTATSLLSLPVFHLSTLSTDTTVKQAKALPVYRTEPAVTKHTSAVLVCLKILRNLQPQNNIILSQN